MSINKITYDNLVNIEECCLSSILQYKYETVYKLYNINSYFRNCINNILINDSKLLLDIIYYIFDKKIKINIKSLYFRDIFEEWSKNHNKNIYTYVLFIEKFYNSKKSIYNIGNILKYCDKDYNEMFKIYNNFGLKLLKNIYLRHKGVENIYKDKYNRINNKSIALEYILKNKDIVYTVYISRDLYDYKDEDNFNILKCAIKKHSTLYKTLKLLGHLKDIDYNKTLKLLQENNNIYQYIPHNYKYCYEILRELIFNSKNVLKFVNNQVIKYNDNIVNYIIKINKEYNLNELVDINKNYIYYILHYLTNLNITNNIKEYIISNLDNNLLFKECYVLLKKYIDNMNYKMFDINSVFINLLNLEYSNNNNWKIFSYKEVINEDIKDIVQEYNKLCELYNFKNKIIEDNIKIIDVINIVYILNRFDSNYVLDYYKDSKYIKVVSGLFVGNSHKLLLNLEKKLKYPSTYIYKEQIEMIINNYMVNFKNLETIETKINFMLS